MEDGDYVAIENLMTSSYKGTEELKASSRTTIEVNIFISILLVLGDDFNTINASSCKDRLMIMCEMPQDTY